MGLLASMTKEQLVKFEALKEDLLDAVTIDEVHYYNGEIHRLLDEVEKKDIQSRLEKAEETGMIKLARNMVLNGMTVEDIAKHTKWNAEELSAMLNRF